MNDKERKSLVNLLRALEIALVEWRKDPDYIQPLEGILKTTIRLQTQIQKLWPSTSAEAEGVEEV